jgi:hypothetical protein
MPEDARDIIKPVEKKQTQAVEFVDPVRFLSTVSFTELPETPVLSAPLATTTISVLNTERVKLQNTGAVTLTDFLYGAEGQQISVLGDGFTTVTHGSLIKTNTAANKLLAANTVYSFTRFNSVWVETTAGSATTYSAGTGLSLTSTTFANKYVGKSLSLIANGITTTLSAGNTVHAGATGRHAARIDTTNMGNVRVSASTDGSGATGNHSIDLYYSTNAGGAWTLITVGITVTNTSGQLVTGTVALPGGAIGSAIWFSPALTSTSTTGSNVLYTFVLEFTP